MDHIVMSDVHHLAHGHTHTHTHTHTHIHTQYSDAGAAPDAATMDAMEKRATLERFARENPGFDFSGATVTGNYTGGGPALPEGR